MTKSDTAFRTISEVAEELGVQQHVLRFWETKFNAIKPLKRGGGRRYYRPEDVALVKKIHALLYTEGYTIKGVQKLIKGVSKSSVLAEQKMIPNAQGTNLPYVTGVGIETEIPVSSVTLTKLVLSDKQKQNLREILNDLLEARELLLDTQTDIQSSAKAAS